jgi:hypothetical protein
MKCSQATRIKRGIKQARDDYIDRVDHEVAGLFEQPNIRAAARALAEILTSTCEIDATQHMAASLSRWRFHQPDFGVTDGPQSMVTGEIR